MSIKRIILVGLLFTMHSIHTAAAAFTVNSIEKDPRYIFGYQQGQELGEQPNSVSPDQIVTPKGNEIRLPDGTIEYIALEFSLGFKAGYLNGYVKKTVNK